MDSGNSLPCVHATVDHYHPFRFFWAFLLHRKKSINHFTCVSCGAALRFPRLLFAGWIRILCFLLSVANTFGWIWLMREKHLDLVVGIALWFVLGWLLYRVPTALILALGKWEPREASVSEEEEEKRFRTACSPIHTAIFHGMLLSVWILTDPVPMSVVLGWIAFVVLVGELTRDKEKRSWFPVGICGVVLLYAIISFFCLDKAFPDIRYLNILLFMAVEMWALGRM